MLALAVSALGALSTATPKRKQRRVYNKKFKQAPWAPPGWLFGPVWTINNFFLLKALIIILSMNKGQDKKQLLYQQAMIWIIFFTFGFVYFKKKSPILAAIWTIADNILAVSGFIKAGKFNKQLSFYYLPLLTWTAFAGSVAVYQALKNEDPFLKLDPARQVR